MLLARIDEKHEVDTHSSDDVSNPKADNVPLISNHKYIAKERVEHNSHQGSVEWYPVLAKIVEEPALAVSEALKKKSRKVHKIILLGLCRN